MKKISKRAWMAMALALALLAGLLVFLGDYFVNAKTWVTFPGSPHVYTGVNPDCGRIYDRAGTLLLNTDDGRVYSSDENVVCTAPKAVKASPKAATIKVDINTMENGKPMEPGKYARQILVITNDPNHPRHTVNLTWAVK